MRKLCWLVATSIALIVAPATVAGQAATIAGRVTGELGQPLGSVQLFIPSLNIGTISRADGNYLLLVPAGRFTSGQSVEVQASMVGFRQATGTVALQAGTLTLNFALSIDPLRLEEVIVTGAGLTSRAERLGTARSTVTENQVARASESNIVTALAAKAPNIVTTSAGGEPGSSTAIRIRGMSTLAGTGEPTIIVDGMPINNVTRTGGFRGAGGSPLQGPAYSNRAIDINPDDIESIEILKGPSAMSLLGASAGAGGAILITTKRGRPGVTRYSWRSEVQVDQPVGKIPVQRRFGSGTGGVATPCLANPTPGCTHNNQNWGPLIPTGTPTYDHNDAIFDTGQMIDNTITMSGGTESTTFYLSLGALNHNGFVVGDNDRFNRYSVRLNAGHALRENLRVAGNVSYVQTGGRFMDRGNSTNGLMLPTFRAPPDWDHRQYLDPETGLHRSYRYPAPRPQDLAVDRGWVNPLFAINENPNTQQTGRVFGNVTANWRPLTWLDVNYALGADYSNDDRTEALHPSSAGAAVGGQITRHQFYDRVIDHTLTATASWTLSPELEGTFSVGQNLNETYMRQIWVQGNRFIAPTPYKLENTVSRLLPSDREYRRRLAGHYAQVEADYAEQLFVTGRVRVDGSSTFGLDNQFATYPGGQVSWVFTRTFDVPEERLAFGRVRFAYGESGQEPSLYQLQDTFQATQIVDFNPGSTLVPSLNGFGGLYSSATLGNPTLRPERVRELDAGVDLSFLGGRADLGVTYYLSNASDVIFAVDTPPSTGATSQVLNAAEIENRGWELTLNTIPVQTADFGLNVGLNWSANKNEVISLGNVGETPRQLTGFASSFTGLGQTFAEVGHPIGVMRGTSLLRCGHSKTTTVGSVNVAQVCNGQPDGAVYIGADGLPVYDSNQRILGDANPDWTAGLNAELSYRGVRVSAFLEHREGGETLNGTRGSMRQFGTHADTDIRDQPARPWIEWLDHAKLGPAFGPGADTDVQLGQTWFAGWTQQQDLIVEDATHTRLREVSVAYTFTQPWVARTLGLSGIDARVTARNLALWTEYAGFDPDIHIGGAALGNRGIDWWALPTARSWVISVGLNR